MIYVRIDVAYSHMENETPDIYDMFYLMQPCMFVIEIQPLLNIYPRNEQKANITTLLL